MHHTDISHQNLNCSLMNRRSATDGEGGRGSSERLIPPLQHSSQANDFKTKKKTVLSLPHYIFLIETQCIAASVGTIIVAPGALS